MGEAVAGGAGFDDGAVVGQAVHDRGAQPGVGEGVGPATERLIRCDGDAVLLFAFGQDLEEQFGAAAVQFHVAQFVDDQQVDPPVAGDRFGEGFVVGALDEFVH